MQAYRREKIEQGCFYAWELSFPYDERSARFLGTGNPFVLFPACGRTRCDRGAAHHHDRLHDITQALSKTTREEEQLP